MDNPRQQAAALIQRGFSSQQAGDAAAAAADYRQALALQAEHPAALQLLGQLARRAGDPQQAEALMRRSLAADPRQPHVWNNLGNLLSRAGIEGALQEPALACFERALALQPRFAEARYNRARVLLVLGRLEDAARALQGAVDDAGAASAQMLALRARIESEQGQIDAALATIDQALALAPDRASLHHDRGRQLLLLHRAADAVAAHGQAHALGLNVADAHYNRGNALQAAGRLDDAVQAYRQALVCEADHSLALYDLARLRWRLGDADFDDELLQASAASPASSVAPGVRAQLLMRAGRHADAAEGFEAALTRAPSVAAFHDGLARCHARLGRFDHSLQAHRRALSLAPQDAALRGAHAMTLLMAKRPEQAAAEALATIELDPHDQMAPALLGLAWRVMGDPREAWLNDHARFVQVLDLAPPSGFDDMASFNEALRRELEALHVDRAAPVDQTLRHGTQTIGCIFEQRHALVDALKVRIAEAVDRFIAGLPEDAGHPFLRQRSTGWRFTDSWSSRLESGGFHTRHVHPHGWISSAYYVSVPPGIEASSTYEGWLELGAPDFECGLPEPVVRRVMPRAGRLVLFPSMVWHGTRPVHGPAARLSLAFDVRPR